MAFYQKYRSKTFSELLGQGHISDTLKEAVKSDKVVHAYLFTGPRGIGKTSTARILARAINCEKGKTLGEPCNECQSCKDIIDGRAIDVTEIDAASHTGVDDVREIIEKARLMPAQLAKKVYIIDEVHMLSKSAFNALLKTLEEPPTHVVFIMATTEIQKIPATIISRAQRYDFKRAGRTDLVSNLRNIAKSEKIEIDDDSLELIALAAEGGYRDSISLFEQVASLSSKITITDTRNILGIPEGAKIDQFLRAIFNANPEEGLKIAHDLYEDGVALTEFNKMIIECLRKTLLFKISGQALFDDTKENIEIISNLSKLAALGQLRKYLDIFIQAGALLKDVAYPVLPLEMAVVEATALGQRSEVRGQKQDEKSEATGRKSEVGAQENTKSQDQVASSEKPEAEDQADNQTPFKSPNLKPSTNHELLTSDTQPPTNDAPAIEESDTVAVPVLEMTDDAWTRIIDTLKKENASLAALLKDAKPMNIDKNEILLGVKFAFHKDRISESKNRSLLEKAVLEVVGHKCQIKCEIADLTPKLKEPVSGEALVKAVDEIFE